MGRDTLVNFILVAGFILFISLFTAGNINGTPKKQEKDLKTEHKTMALEEKVDSPSR